MKKANTKVSDSSRLCAHQLLSETLTLADREEELCRLEVARGMVELLKEEILLYDDAKTHALLELALPLITQSEYADTILQTFYIEVAFHNRPITPEIQDINETAFRTVVLEYDKFFDLMDAEFPPPYEINPRASTIVASWRLASREGIDASLQSDT